jgi:hypothetical protein
MIAKEEEDLGKKLILQNAFKKTKESSKKQAKRYLENSN